MSINESRAGRGRHWAAAVCAMLLLVGAGVLGYALLNQHGEPPQAPLSSGASDGREQDSDGVPAPSADTDEPTSEPSDTSESTSESSPGSEESPTSDPSSTPSVDPLAASQPESVSIPAIEVESTVNPIGLNDDGTLAVPTGENYDEAAWFTGSPTPGEVGPSVIEGHVTSAGSTPSVFFDLGAVEEGDTAEVTREDGTTATFEVYKVERYPKDEFPTAVVYGNTQSPELRLITCSGEYDEDDSRHLDNTVVYARMVAST